ncbi:hypothetical protein [Kushneria aurantia]|uniref:Uncharacterized protein n=1 Tax=Kushneria aurantia TaxID=504092 RepID=A0ABV6FZF0_9GAMM|nr:hypothetical protein [Kushneria aurantia]
MENSINASSSPGWGQVETGRQNDGGINGALDEYLMTGNMF